MSKPFGWFELLVLGGVFLTQNDVLVTRRVAHPRQLFEKFLSVRASLGATSCPYIA